MCHQSHGNGINLHRLLSVVAVGLMVNFKLLSWDPTGIADPQVSTTILSLHDSEKITVGSLLFWLLEDPYFSCTNPCR